MIVDWFFIMTHGPQVACCQSREHGVVGGFVLFHGFAARLVSCGDVAAPRHCWLLAARSHDRQVIFATREIAYE
jgi:hypothetical protein